ncbi:hypothetical protein CFOL_v3_03346 [Cephalotus follicularis]|uniref:TPX2 C-terminal domain-containing protein n=1 Tax=Cephalotus follicularis TaxID=3775 RepID=A0A1Q3AVW4_CEPFO|nr:hypothetical protein CFOL_v3_03346 [Cephalotus follicularis]
MGESARLVRSFSHPSDASREAKEGDPIPSLTESISFGRFMSESLDWEKWSTFSHNRYLEEVEKFSKPGSVAQKKAYFEAHYRRKAAMKAENLYEEANSVVTNEIQNDSPMDAEAGKADSSVAISNEQEKDIPDTVIAYSADLNESSFIVERDDFENNEVPSYPVVGRDNSGKEERVEPVTEQNVKLQNPIRVENSKQLENADKQDKNVAIPEENMTQKETFNRHNLGSSGKKSHADPTPKSSTHSGAFKLPLFPSKRSGSEKYRNEGNAAPNSKKSGEDSNNTRILVSKSIHMSINVGSRASETRTSLILPKDNATSPQTQTRAYINLISKHPSQFLQSEDKRAKTLVSKPVLGGITGEAKCRTISADATGSKTQSPIKCSPFSLRTEERAAKQKEIFKKLEARTKANEAEKGQLQTRSKEKAKHDLKQLHASTGFQAEEMKRGSQSPSKFAKEKEEHDLKKLRASIGFQAEDVKRGSRSPCNFKKIPLTQIPLTRPRSPKLGRKPTTSKVQEASSRSPRRPSVSTEGSKRVIQKNNQSTTCSVTSLLKKNAHENASPNIQR